MASTPDSVLPGQGLTGKPRNPVLVWLVWPLITLGIYHLYWWYKINDEARRLDPSIDVNPLLSLLALFPGVLIIVPPFVTVYRTGGRLRSMQQAGGLPPNVLPIIGLLLMFSSSPPTACTFRSASTASGPPTATNRRTPRSLSSPDPSHRLLTGNEHEAPRRPQISVV
jgi:hypothetical protein